MDDNVNGQIAGKRGLGRSRFEGPEAARRRFPALAGDVLGAVVYLDAQMDDARLVLSLLLSAAHHGADGMTSSWLLSLPFFCD
jgi:glycerol-3-phosphate dehydrogenase